MPKKSFIRGWSMVLHSFITYLIYGLWASVAMNIFVPIFVNRYGWDRTLLMTLISVAGILGVVGALLFAQFTTRKGTRIVLAISFVLGGLNVIWFGYAGTLVVFFINVVLLYSIGQGYCNVPTNALIANWFPTRKGVILGLATIGLPMSSVICMPILASLVNKYQLGGAFWVIGVVMVVIGIATWFWIVDTPEQVGLAPDNKPAEIEEIKRVREFQKNYKSQWTFKKMIRDPNSLLIAFGFGLLFLITQGMLGQWVPYMMENGFDQPTALRLLQLQGAVGVVGSFLWGLFDQKVSTKLASIIYGLWYAVAFAILASRPTGALMVFVVCMFGFAVGGIGNLFPSIIAGIYGRYEFASVSRLINPIITVVRSLAFAVVGISSSLLGSVSKTGFVLMGISLLATVLVVLIKIKAPEAQDSAVKEE